MRILVTGASGRLGTALLARLIEDGQHDVVAWSRTTGGIVAEVAFRSVDLSNPRAVTEALAEADPVAVIHAGALSSADAVWRDPAQGRAINIDATRQLAEWAGARNRRFVFTSTDLVFDGSRSWNREDDVPRPVLAYGQTKFEAESHVLAIGPGLVARLSLLFGPSPSGRPSFFDTAMDAMRRGEPRAFFEDEFRTPLDYRTAADALAQLVESDAVGIVHVGGRERLSRLELMQRGAAVLGIDPDLVRPGRLADVSLPEPRPADASLDTSRLAAIVPGLNRPSIEAALRAMAS
jgi:dTDP-4-dehydrorhamnose reductase